MIKLSKHNLVGRPTKFCPAYAKQLIEFFDIPPNRKELVAKSEEYDKVTGKVKFKKEEWKRVPNELPTIYKFAKEIGVSYFTIWNWVKQANEGKEEFKEFSNALERAKDLYKHFLIENGLLGLYNSTFGIFVAKNTTDMRDESQVNVISVDLVKLLNESRKAKNESNSSISSGVYREPNKIHSGNLELTSATN